MRNMYSLVKDPMANATVYVLNNDTKNKMALGRVTIPLLHELDLAGLSIKDHTLPALSDKWDLPITQKLATTLMTNSVATSNNKTKHIHSETEQDATTNPITIDAYDVLFGRATY